MHCQLYSCIICGRISFGSIELGKILQEMNAEEKIEKNKIRDTTTGNIRASHRTPNFMSYNLRQRFHFIQNLIQHIQCILNRLRRF